MAAAPIGEGIDTERLRLIPWTPAQLLALIEEPDRFVERFGHPAADGLREFMTGGDVSDIWLAYLRRAQAPDPWALGFALLHREGARLIGSAGFKGPPDESGTVEIAYGVAPSFEKQGYATEAARALVDFALADPRVRLVCAHTLPREGPSPGVLRKLGFAFAGEVEDPEDGPVWRWERGREPVGDTAT